MNEPEWLACDDPTELFGSGVCAISPRKVRLDAIACHRHMCFDGQRPWLTIDVLERWSEELATLNVDPASLGIHAHSLQHYHAQNKQ